MNDQREKSIFDEMEKVEDEAFFAMQATFLEWAKKKCQASPGLPRGAVVTAIGRAAVRFGSVTSCCGMQVPNDVAERLLRRHLNEIGEAGISQFRPGKEAGD